MNKIKIWCLKYEIQQLDWLIHRFDEQRDYSTDQHEQIKYSLTELIKTRQNLLMKYYYLIK